MLAARASRSVRLVGRCSSLNGRAQLASVGNRLAGAATADLYIAPPVDDVGLLDARSIKRLLEAGYRAAVEALGRCEGLP